MCVFWNVLRQGPRLHTGTHTHTLIISVQEHVAVSTAYASESVINLNITIIHNNNLCEIWQTSAKCSLSLTLSLSIPMQFSVSHPICRTPTRGLGTFLLHVYFPLVFGSLPVSSHGGNLTISCVPRKERLGVGSRVAAATFIHVN